MGRKFRLSVHRKNEERTRKVTPKLIVFVRLDSVSLMTSSSGVLPRRSSRDHSSALSVVRKRSFVVSIQHDAVSVMSVSLPAECYRMAPAPSLGHVHNVIYMYMCQAVTNRTCLARYNNQLAHSFSIHAVASRRIPLLSR